MGRSGKQQEFGSTLIAQSADIRSPSETELTLRLPIKVMGKPRMTKQDAWAQRPRVQKYWRQCDLIREPLGITRYDKFQGAGKITVTAYFRTPAKALWGTPFRNTPDCDNILKGVCDALFADDKSLYSMLCEKYWSDVDMLEVHIEELMR